MTKLYPRALKAEAAERLRPIAGETRVLMLCCAGVLVLVSLLGEAVNLILQYWISDTGGLSGLGARSILQTLQSLFPYISMIFTPLWSIGFTGVVLRWADGKRAQAKDLCAGFGRFSAVLVHELLKGILLFGLIIFSSNIASVLFMLLPGSAALTQILNEFIESGATDLSALPVQEYLEASCPLLLIFFGILAVLALFLNYNLRLSSYFIMDDPRMGGLAAMKASFQAMRGHKMAFFKLDLSFWWFYLLMIAAILITGAGLFFALQGLAVSLSPIVVYFLAYLLCCGVAAAICAWKLPYIGTTAALAYRKIVTPDEEETV